MAKKKTGRKPLDVDVVSVGVSIEKVLWDEVEKLSKVLGVTRRRIIERALFEYFDSRAVEALKQVDKICRDYFD